MGQGKGVALLVLNAAVDRGEILEPPLNARVVAARLADAPHNVLWPKKHR